MRHQTVSDFGRTLKAVLLVGVFLLFSWGCSNTPSPNDLLVEYDGPSEYLLGPEDIIEVTVWKNQELSRTVIVRPDGFISMPLIGDVLAAGVSPNTLAKRVSERLTEYMASPIVSVQVKEINSYYVYVMGEVLSPGRLSLKSYATFLQAISLAGGFTQFASRNDIQVLRNGENGQEGPHRIRIPVRYDDVISGKGNLGDFVLRRGDTIVVP